MFKNCNGVQQYMYLVLDSSKTLLAMQGWSWLVKQVITWEDLRCHTRPFLLSCSSFPRSSIFCAKVFVPSWFVPSFFLPSFHLCRVFCAEFMFVRVVPSFVPSSAEFLGLSRAVPSFLELCGVLCRAVPSFFNCCTELCRVLKFVPSFLPSCAEF